MKKIFTMILTVIFLCSFATIASAELLFGLSAETGNTDFTANYKSTLLNDVSKSPSMLTFNGDLNLVLLHIYLGYGKADIDQSAFSTVNVQAGWEFGPGLLKAKLFGGYQAYDFNDSALPLAKDNLYASLVAGVGVESKFDKFGFYGTTYFPIATRYSNGVNEDNNASINYLKLGASYAPIPFIDIFVNYTDLKADSNVLTITNKGYTTGVKFSF